MSNTNATYKVATREESIEKYKHYFENRIITDTEFFKQVEELKNNSRYRELNLVCFCKPKDCHGDIIKKYIEEHY